MKYPTMHDAGAIVRWLRDDVYLSDQAIADLTFSSRSTIWHIRHDKQSGRNLLPRLQNLVRMVYENEQLA